MNLAWDDFTGSALRLAPSRAFRPNPFTFHEPNGMAPIDVALTQFLGTVKALSVVVMAKTVLRSFNESAEMSLC